MGRRSQRLAWVLACFVPLAACTDRPIQITGRVLGHDGRPLPHAEVSLLGRPPVEVVVGDDGRFSLQVDRPGGQAITFTGIHHTSDVYPLLVEPPGPVEIEVLLGTGPTPEAPRQASVIGEFNRYSRDEGAVPMLRLADGTFTATLDVPSGRLAYQILLGGEAGEIVEGTQADEYARRDPRFLEYVSVVRAPAGRATIVFDPRRLPPAGLEAKVDFKDRRGGAARLLALDREGWRLAKRHRDEREAFRRSGGRDEEFRYDPTSDRQALLRLAEADPHPVIRQYGLILCFLGGRDAVADPALGRRLMEEVAPDSPAWSLLRHWRHPHYPFELAAGMTGDPEAADRYARSVADRHPDRRIREGFLFYLLQQASEHGRTDEARQLYDRLAADSPDGSLKDEATLDYAPDRNVMIGKTIPDFSVPSVDDPAHFISRDAIKGKFVLIDFWGTWCGSCIAEMEQLHRIHKKYLDRNFAILSIAYDKKIEDVRRFRAKEWPMPWLNGFAQRTDGDDNPTTAAFEVFEYPTHILVDPAGTVLATRYQLYDEELETTLDRFLPGPSGARPGAPADPPPAAPGGGD